MATSIEDWMCQELSKLGIPASEENAKYILSIESAEDLQEHVLELLDGSSPGVSKFIEQLLQRWQPPDKPPDNIKVYRKSIADDVYYGGKEKQVLDKQKKNKNNSSNTPLPSLSYDQLQNGVEQNGGASVHLSNKQIQESKKKSKFVPLFSQEGQEKTVIKLPGRHACECQAAKHRLINNCTKCGRVVCEQEGSGPCIFCGTLVCTREEMEILMRGSKKSEQLRYRLMKDSDRVEYMLNGESHDVIQKPNKSLKELEKAVKHKEKLLDYDRTSVRRTKVIDDESDYFTSDNKWLSKADKEKLKKREEELRALRHASRRDRKVTLDFAGRTVVVNDSVPTVNMYDVNDDVIQEVHFGAKSTKLRQEDRELNSLVNPDIEVEAPKFVTSGDKQGSKPSTKPGTQKKRDLMRIQDRELLEMSDDGMCMSMHQPWASLLVLGIKIHEGRTWYTPHRGRLWIAATSKSPALEEIADVEQSYRFLLKDANLQLPSHYPIGCLLGCVEVVDCLSQEEYREKFPDGESASPFVFICENPQELVVKFPIKGKHKIYKLENHIHQAAKKGLR